MTNNGDIVWYELLTSDPKAAIAFYTDVAGWTTQTWGGTYTMWVSGQGPLGGVSELPEQARAMGAGPYWQANIQVASVDESIATVTKLGGKVLHVETVPEVGKIAVIADPQGAVIALFTPSGEGMAAKDRARPGEFSWHELYTTDNEAGFAFYHQIAGWDRMGEFDMGPNGKYVLWGRNGAQLGGMMIKPADMKTPDGRDVPPSWMFYITTADLEAALGRAKARGATVIMGPMPVPGGQQVVLMIDPQGAAFSLVTPPNR